MRELKTMGLTYDEEFDINIMPYLIFNQINIIVKEILAEEDIVNRMMIKDMYILKFATDIDIEDNITNEEYDKYLCSGILDRVKSNIVNLYIIDELVEKSENVNIVLKSTLKSLEMSIDNFLIGSEKTFEKIQKKIPKEIKNLNINEIMTLIKDKVNKIDK